MELKFHPTPCSKRSQLHKICQKRCTAKNSWWWAEGLPETYRVVIPIKLEFSASVGFIHKEVVGPVYGSSLELYGHTSGVIVLQGIGQRFERVSYVEFSLNQTFLPLRPRQEYLKERRQPCTRLHDVTFRKTVLFIVLLSECKVLH